MMEHSPIEEMAFFDALDPLTRSVLSEAPELLEARKLVSAMNASPEEIRRLDRQVADMLADMITSEHGPNWRVSNRRLLPH